MRRRASSIAFCTATGTSFAFPLPMPTRPSPSPTTVNAAKARMRPPFTTFVTRLMLIIFSRSPSPRSSCCCRCCCLPIGFAIFRLVFRPALELETALAGGVGQRLHAAVIFESGAVERDGLDAGGLRLLRNALADHGRSRAVAAVLQILAHVGLERRGADQHPVSGRRDDLRINMVARPPDDEAMRAVLGDAQPGFAAAADTSVPLVHGPLSPISVVARRLLLLCFLERYLLIGVANALALVRLGRAIRAYLRRNLAHLLLVDALDDDFGLLRRFDLDAFGHLVHDGMRETQRQVDPVACGLRAVADAYQCEPL